MLKSHVVVQGEGMSSIAHRYGFFWQTLWLHDANARLREARSHPEMLRPGDVVQIPEIGSKEVTVQSGRVHRFRRRGVPANFQLRLLRGRMPRAEESYILEVDGVELKGITDGEGWIRLFLPPNAREGRLSLADGRESYTLKFGCINPVNTPAGAQAVLRNLGYFHGDIKDVWEDSAIEALKQFQREHGQSPTGELDAETSAALKAAYEGGI